MPNTELYYERASSVPGPVSELLEQYSGIQKDEQLEHIISVRNRAYTAHQYPCLGRFRFLELELSAHYLYNSYVVPTLKQSIPEGEREPIFLDLGTCLGQDLRKLAFDGAPPSRLYGSDIEQAFIETGYELFRDEQKLPRNHFLCPADVFDESPENKLKILKDKVDILNASAVFHLFDEASQISVARCCMRLLRKDAGCKSLVLGAHVGNTTAKETMRYNGGKKFRHNEKSWKALWEELSQEDEFREKIQGLEVRSNVSLENWTPGMKQMQSGEKSKDGQEIEEGFRWMRFEVWVTF